MGDGGGGSGAAALSLEDLMFPLVTLMLFRRSSLMERCNLFSFFLSLSYCLYGIPFSSSQTISLFLLVWKKDCILWWRNEKKTSFWICAGQGEG